MGPEYQFIFSEPQAFARDFLLFLKTDLDKVWRRYPGRPGGNVCNVEKSYAEALIDHLIQKHQLNKFAERAQEIVLKQFGKRLKK
jgi:hypothetical protein